MRNLEPSTFSRCRALPATTQTVTYESAGIKETHTYTGTSFWKLLDGAGIAADPNVKNDVLNMYVVATGSDGYKAVLALGELKSRLRQSA